MNAAATFDFTEVSFRPVATKVAREGVRDRLATKKSCNEVELRWSARASELLSAFDDDALPATSGQFGSFLY